MVRPSRIYVYIYISISIYIYIYIYIYIEGEREKEREGDSEDMLTSSFNVACLNQRRYHLHQCTQEVFLMGMWTVFAFEGGVKLDIAPPTGKASNHSHNEQHT